VLRTACRSLALLSVRRSASWRSASRRRLVPPAGPPAARRFLRLCPHHLARSALTSIPAFLSTLEARLRRPLGLPRSRPPCLAGMRRAGSAPEELCGHRWVGTAPEEHRNHVRRLGRGTPGLPPQGAWRPGRLKGRRPGRQRWLRGAPVAGHQGTAGRDAQSRRPAALLSTRRPVRFGCSLGGERDHDYPSGTEEPPEAARVAQARAAKGSQDPQGAWHIPLPR